MSTTTCAARVGDYGGWSDHPCERKGKFEREGRLLCLVHARKFDERGYDYATFWWGWPPREATAK